MRHCFNATRSPDYFGVIVQDVFVFSFHKVESAVDPVKSIGIPQRIIDTQVLPVGINV